MGLGSRQLPTTVLKLDFHLKLIYPAPFKSQCIKSRNIYNQNETYQSLLYPVKVMVFFEIVDVIKFTRLTFFDD